MFFVAFLFEFTCQEFLLPNDLPSFLDFLDDEGRKGVHDAFVDFVGFFFLEVFCCCCFRGRGVLEGAAKIFFDVLLRFFL